MNYKICVDPGHGGKDPGAVGPTGVEEASVALLIAGKVVNGLQDLGMQTLMTRTTDVFIELGDRCAIANDWYADYFVSVHLNSNGGDAAGIETLYKSDKGKAVAKPVQEAMVMATEDKDRGLKYRDDLYVLNGTNMPAILAEVGFISNPDFEILFDTDEYQEILADAIVSGLAAFLGLPVPIPVPPQPEPVIATVTITVDAPSNVRVNVVSAGAATSSKASKKRKV
jgi:N-acetylmuramoyl-L-alanine amidase